MSAFFTLPEQAKIVDATAGPVTTNGGVTGRYVSLKNCARAYLVLQFTQAVGHATVVTAQRATAVAPTNAGTIAHDARLWLNEDTAATDTLVRQTDGKTVTVTDDAKKKMVVIEFDPAAFGEHVSAGPYDVAGFTVSNSSQATNFVSGTWYLVNHKYQQATPPTAITD